MNNANLRKNIVIGSEVKIVEDQNRKSGELTIGIVKNILTNSSEHPYGIKVMLDNGEIGRVKEIIMSNVDIQNNQKKDFTIEEKLLQGEGSVLEYKSSFKFDVNRFIATKVKAHSKEVEKEISIAIAAFANTDGGTLLIGVGDNGVIFGIEEDIILFFKKSKELFQRHLWQSIKNYLNNNNFVLSIKLNFYLIEDKEICELKVPRASEPIYVTDSLEECYVRMGNRTEKLKPSDFNKYCKKRFG